MERDFSKQELIELFYNLMAVGKTIANSPEFSSMENVGAFGLAVVGSLLSAQLSSMEDSDVLHVSVEDIPSWNVDEV